MLARSGGSIFEIAAAGRPSILVPYPYAAQRHQHANADWMADGGAAVVIEDSELEPARLRALAGELLGDPDAARARWRAAARALARPDAAERVAAELLGAIREPSCRDEQRRLERARAALHRHRRRRDERPGAGLPTRSAPG